MRHIGHNHGLDRNDQKIRNHRQYLPYDYYLYHHGLGHIGKTEGDRSKFFQSGHKVTIFSCRLVDVLGEDDMRRGENLQEIVLESMITTDNDST